MNKSCHLADTLQALKSSKVGGNKNPLSPQEQAYYSEQLSNLYQIGSQLGRSGEDTSAYLLTDKSGKKFVLKIPNDPLKTQGWLKQQQLAIKNRDTYVGDYNGPICVPKTIKIGRDFVVEEFAAGTEFSEKVYDSLSGQQKKKLAQDFATFLNHSHQRTFSGNGPAFNTTWKSPTFDEIFNYFAEAMTPTEQKVAKNYQNHFMKPTQEPQVLAFSDYRFQNMLWDSETQKLSIIDFGCTDKKSVYAEFTPFAASSYHSSYQFLLDVIQYYNKLPKKHPIHIDPRQVETNHIMGIYHEFGRCGIKRSFSPEQQMHWLRPTRRSVNRAFKNFYNTQQRNSNENT